MTIPNYESLHWRETSPGRWERGIDEAEQFYTTMARVYEGSGRVFFGMTGHLSLSVPVENGSSRPETKDRVYNTLRRAWLQLRYDHPTIASWTELDALTRKSKKVYQMFGEGSAQDVWLDETLRVVETGVTGKEWCNGDPPVPKMPTVFMVVPAEAGQEEGVFRCDLVLRCHHDIIDGIGTLHLLDNLIKNAAGAWGQLSTLGPLVFGDEAKNLSPPLRVAASIPTSLSPEQQAQCDELEEYNASLQSGVEIASLPYAKGAERPGIHQRVDLTLPEDETQRVLAACKKMGISVTHAYHAGIAIIVRDLQPRAKDERMVRYINYCLINERSHCNPPYNTPTHAASVYHSVSGRSLIVDMAVPAAGTSDAELQSQETTEFKHVASEIKKHYLEIRDDAGHLPKAPLYWAKGTPPYPDPKDGAVPPVPKPDASPSVSISSMGVIDRIITPTQGVFELSDPWVTGEELGTGLGVFLGTFRGQLALSAAYNDAWHERNEAVDFLTRCNEVVWRGLGL
ncbi:hypothetical protein P170DRAFT_469305 [Aspergillus steynii IBT 23096]|uniref:Condensation domain-containing protein n=1 Tax=Aspergillus steynii IBT 23096 TaxID=1392250 RepID=A0A2I2GLR9_9EURO|nr:uncharacterized protein P170DRAFT_469305 [Aspergillus steynii IBT 23096]PLB53817.1 hypothetical protein P170DRAFT_469305 [Aspergillus steynii IBT 23096]